LDFVERMIGGALFIVGIGVVLGVVSGGFMLALIFVIRHRYRMILQQLKRHILKNVGTPRFSPSCKTPNPLPCYWTAVADNKIIITCIHNTSNVHTVQGTAETTVL